MAFPPLELPINSVTLEVVSNGIRTQSPYSFAQTPYDFMGGMWAATIDLSVMDRRQRAVFVAFIASLDGQVGTFELPVFDYAGPFGVITQNPVVAVSAPVRGKTVSITVAAGDALAIGDRITIDGHMHVITKTVDVVGADQVVEIWPRLRASVANGDVVEALAPFGTWHLENARNGIRSLVDTRTVASLSLMEAI